MRPGQIMPHPSESKPGLFSRSSRKNYDPAAAMNAPRIQELRASLAVLRARRWAERRERFLSLLPTYWPIALGLLLGAIAPGLRAAAAAAGPWCMVLVFPFVLLAARPEIQAGGPITHALPAIMLYAQFPIEGWLARFILKRRTRISSVVVQVLLFHFLGIFELVLLSSGWSNLFAR